MRDIETGVDKLVDLIEKKKRITLNQAAKELGVSSVLVQEWADFLEEDNLISVDYSLSKVWLEEKQLTKKEVEKKEREFESKKDSFIRKVETTLQSLEKDTIGFEKMKTEFNELNKEIGGEIGFVKKEVKELEYYEELKNKIDADIEVQKTEYAKMMDASHREIKVEERRYQEMIAQISREKQKVRKEQIDIKSLEEKELLVEKQIASLRENLDAIKEELKRDNTHISVSDETIQRLNQFVERIETRLKVHQNDAILPLIKLSEEHRSKITNLQKDMIKKLDAKKGEIDGYKSQNKKVYSRLEKFFNKKEQAEKLLKKIDDDKEKLKKEYDDLSKKAFMFNAISKKSNVKTHISEMNESYKKIEEHKSSLHKEIGTLSKLLKG